MYEYTEAQLTVTVLFVVYEDVILFRPGLYQLTGDILNPFKMSVFYFFLNLAVEVAPKLEQRQYVVSNMGF